MEPDIQLLELADGIKNTLINSGYLTIKSVLDNTMADISSKLGVDPYIAQIIFQEAKRVAAEMTEVSVPLDISVSVPEAIAVEKEKPNPV